HSMGGLVARYALELAGPAPACVTDLFTLATPHRGSQLAHDQELYQFIQIRLRPTAAAELVAEGLGEAWVEVRAGSGLLRKLNQARRPGGVRYHALRGKKALIGPDQRAALQREFERFLRRQRLRPEDEQRLLAHFANLAEIVHGTGDAAVTLGSADL